MLVTFIKNLIIVNKSILDGLTSLIIPSLEGIATAMNPSDVFRISGSEASWMCKCDYRLVTTNYCDFIFDFNCAHHVV